MPEENMLPGISGLGVSVGVFCDKGTLTYQLSKAPVTPNCVLFPYELRLISVLKKNGMI